MKRKNKKISLNNKTLKILSILFLLILITMVLTLIIINKPGVKLVNPTETLEFTKAKLVMGVNKKQFINEKEKRLDLDQVNDIILELKQKDVNQNEKIKNVTIEDFKIIQKPEKGKVKVLLPDSKKKEVYTSKSEDMLGKKIGFKPADTETKMVFRIENSDVFSGKIDHPEKLEKNKTEENKEPEEPKNLLSSIKSQMDKARFKVSFDIIVKFENNQKYKTTLSLELPTSNDVIDKTVDEKIDISKLKFNKVK